MRDYTHAPVRWRPEGPELRCESCAAAGRGAYWPLTLEFWYPLRGMTRCRACIRERDNATKRARSRSDPAYRAAACERSRRERGALYQDPVALRAFRAKRAAASRRWRGRRRAA